MKATLISILFSLSLLPNQAAFAAGANFAKLKSEFLSQLDNHIEKAKSHRACVAAASDKAALKQCRTIARQWMQQERQARLARKQNRTDF